MLDLSVERKKELHFSDEIFSLLGKFKRTNKEFSKLTK